MKILLFTDNHFCSTSSIIRQRGEKFSIRLENQISSINWVEELGKNSKCDLIVCLGDFFDKPTLNDEELTALKEIKWCGIPHYFVVGNHESSVNGLTYNSTNTLRDSVRVIVSSPTSVSVGGDIEMCFLPYVIESDRKSINDVFGTYDRTKKKRIIFSHNDVKCLNLGGIVSQNGYEIRDIEQNCDLFINGHLHNGTKFCKNGINLGNLTGQNFGEDAFKYKHCSMILDTSTLKYELIENPFAMNFYKIEMNEDKDINILNKVNSNSVISFKCKDTVVDKLKEHLNSLISDGKKILDYRITIVNSVNSINGHEISTELSVDHLSKFVEFCKEKIGTYDIVLEELGEVCK